MKLYLVDKKWLLANVINYLIYKNKKWNLSFTFCFYLYNKKNIFLYYIKMNQEIKKILFDLIKIESISSDVEKNYDVVSYVENYFLWLENVVIKKYIFNNKISIIIQNFEWLDADIMFNWHLDVVFPSEDNHFDPIEKDWKIYARGAWDMKSWNAIMMVVMKEVLLNKYTDKKISLLFTTDEEIGWFDWVNMIVNKENYRPKCVIIPDSWDVENIVIAEKWLIRLKTEIKWKSCHASRAWLWENAIEKSFLFYKELKNIFEEKDNLVPPKYWWSSVNLTIINSWNSYNMVPDKAEVTFDIRVTQNFWNMPKNISLIEDMLKKYDWTILEVLTWDLLFTNKEDENLTKYLICSEKILWKKPNLSLEHWASDWRFFSWVWIPVILHRPTCANIHAKWEYVEIEAINKIFNIYKEFVYF